MHCFINKCTSLFSVVKTQYSIYKENKLILLAVWKTKGPASGGLIYLSSAEGFMADGITMATVCTVSHDEKEDRENRGLSYALCNNSLS